LSFNLEATKLIERPFFSLASFMEEGTNNYL
jgi:hypothetical protein